MASKKKKNVVQELIGLKEFSQYGLSTTRGELLMYLVAPTNISVLSRATIELKVRHLMLVLSSIPDIEIACTDSSECFDDNKAYLIDRAEAEHNPLVNRILRKDIQFLDTIQVEMATARQFLFIARTKSRKQEQVFTLANRVEKEIAEQGFEVHRMSKEEIKRFLALYFDASYSGEQMPDVDGAQYFNLKGGDTDEP